MAETRLGELRLSEKEQNLVKELLSQTRKVPYGEIPLTLFTQGGQPVRIEFGMAKKSVKL